MKGNIVFYLVILGLSVAGCSKETDGELWAKVEFAKGSKNWDSTLQVCNLILKEYPGSRYTSWAQFGVAESYRFKNRPREALDNYKLFYEHYPDEQPAALSLFLVGYLYNNEVKNEDSAKFYYTLFLQRFPHHDLSPSVKMELESFGKTPGEILDERQKKAVIK